MTERARCVRASGVAGKWKGKIKQGNGCLSCVLCVIRRIKATPQRKKRVVIHLFNKIRYL